MSWWFVVSAAVQFALVTIVALICLSLIDRAVIAVSVVLGH